MDAVKVGLVLPQINKVHTVSILLMYSFAAILNQFFWQPGMFQKDISFVLGCVF